MAMPAALRALTIFYVLAVLAAYQAEGRHHQPDCPSFSCGPLANVSSPFRQASDPPGCGYQSYELVCSDTKAMIHIGDATYYVSGINNRNSSFWVVDADLDLHNSCPLPRWNPPNPPNNMEIELRPLVHSRACFVKCSQEVKGTGTYMPVACLSTNDSFVYVLTGHGSTYIEYLEPSCGYLAVTPRPWDGRTLENASYEDVVKSMRIGFAVRFPYPRESIKQCLIDISKCSHNNRLLDLEVAGWFILAPLAMLIFLAYKYWKTRITIDAVDKFLRMQQMIGPTRYAYTDITAVTSHFRDKLGQGGYGSVFKGVLLPGNVHIAVKMLDGKSNCNGEDFISEVSTIGRIHHVNVVRLLGFCPEEMRQALVYEYMPRGSLDRYIFSSERSFSWDKLAEIALGIAKGIDYLHQGCEMQILHFDIKPHNILLDNNFVPKVADFGLAKLYPRDNSFVPSRALRGTIGYIAPEMISRSFGVVSSKSDVYSFGMLLLEMAGGRRNADPNAASSSQAYYPSWVYGRLAQQDNVGEISAQVDTEMHELERKLCIVGLWCIQMKSHDRPTMSEVIEMLEGVADALQMPSRPFFCDEGHAHTENIYHLSSELTEISQEDMSENIGV
ncbi:rust resistance kinase Lr10-like [Hordeum vulgare subsp. vulgare]|uniref:rust resistance kinase Lr10-like n=1 Tax=Hordeum vulgare subsp. vulgare TaxID=112509 RepID=UPI001D1A5A03|nr:rust resistance kinase Lr10-like [Hordeum vulgare subsp. vulgare]